MIINKLSLRLFATNLSELSEKIMIIIPNKKIRFL